MEVRHCNILQRINELYNKYGIKSVTMDDICRELGISKKTLYEFFKDKEELVDKVCDYEHERNIRLLDDEIAKAENAIHEMFLVNKYLNDRFKEWNPAIDYDLKKYHYNVFQKNSSKVIEIMYDFLSNNLKRGLKEKLYRSDIDPDFIAKIHISRIVSMYNSNVFTREEILDKAHHRKLIEYHIRGIASEKGIKMLEKELAND